MDKSTSINHCTSSISTVRNECQKANGQFMYKTYTMQYLADTHLINSTSKLTKSGCFFIKEDEIHCPKCHTDLRGASRGE